MPVVPKLKTSRLKLRPIGETDIEAVHSIMSEDTDITDMIGWSRVRTEEDAISRIGKFVAADVAGTGMTWGVHDRDGLAGSVFFIRMNLQPQGWARSSAMLGYWMASRARGRGYVIEAAQAILDWGFNAGLEKVKVGHVAGNAPSAAIIAKLGFRPVGIERSEFCWPGAEPVDHHLYEMLATEWRREEPR